MSKETSGHPTMKQKISHELVEWLWIFAYLAFFFCVFATYKLVILNQLHIAYFAYGTAAINALVLSKVILIGEYFGVGKKQEQRSVLLSATYKALVFAVLVAITHFLEEGIRGALRGHNLAGILADMMEEGWLVQAVRTVMVFCVFIPFFGFMEIRRKMGKKEFLDLILHVPAA
jgi:hypothetical protein